VNTPSQTKRTRFDRWKNVENIFGVDNPEQIKGNHILLTDDVVTTGSTLEACASELLKISEVKVSIATLAYADF
jgi:predicted amidophosphoribosyltransferase